MGQEDQSRKGRLILMPHRHVSCLVHLVFSTSGRQPTIREQMRDRQHAYLLKSGSSKWIHESFPQSRGFSWQQGYGAFSVSISQQAKTVASIHAQAKHHERVSSAEEFRKFLLAHAMLP